MVLLTGKKGFSEIRRHRALPLGIAIGIFGAVLSAAMPAKANLLQLTDTVKTEPVDKSTVRFEQIRFEQQRREHALQERHLQLARLREGLLAPSQATLQAEPAIADSAATDSTATDSAALDSTATDSDSNTYLYGQQPIPDQPGTVYFVFESQGTAVVGALYMPSSSFDCVEGHISQQQIALSGTDSYSQERFSHAIPLSDSVSVAVASQQGAAAAPPSSTIPSIEGFYPLAVRESDREILAVCQAI